MNTFMKRIELLKGKTKDIPNPNYFDWILSDGSHIPACGQNDPLAFIAYPFYYGGTPSVYPVSWKCNGEDPDGISRSLFEEALNMTPFIKRVDSLKKALEQREIDGITVKYKDGSKKHLEPIKALDELFHNSEKVEHFECSDKGNGSLSELLNGLMDELYSDIPSFDQSQDDYTKLLESPAEPPEDRNEYLKRQIQEVTKSKENPASNIPHCI